jgi:hypothetical protein
LLILRRSARGGGAWGSGVRCSSRICPPVTERAYKEEHDSGAPATDEQLAAAEQALGVVFPADVRELLSEFNGVWCRTHLPDGHELRAILYLDLQHLTVDVPQYFADCGNPLPPKRDRRKVVFVAQANGFGDLWGVCTAEVAGHPAGAVVHLDHEVGELEPSHPSLEEFVRSGRK